MAKKEKKKSVWGWLNSPDERKAEGGKKILDDGCEESEQDDKEEEGDQSEKLTGKAEQEEKDSAPGEMVSSSEGATKSKIETPGEEVALSITEAKGTTKAISEKEKKKAKDAISATGATRVNNEEVWLKQSFVINADALERLRAIAYWERRSLKSVIHEAFVQYLQGKKIKKFTKRDDVGELGDLPDWDE